MFHELRALFGPQQKEREMISELDRMFRNAIDLVRLAGNVCFQRSDETTTLQEIKRADKEVNRLERLLRKEAFAEVLADSKRFSLPFCLSVMNVVKDVERIGDYAKDLATLIDLTGPIEKTSELRRSLAGLADEIDEWMALLPPSLREGDQVTAVSLIEKGKGIRRDLFGIQRALLTEEQSPPKAAAVVLATQYYARIVSHGLNALSTIVTPLDRMDYTSKKDWLPEVHEKLRARDGAQV